MSAISTPCRQICVMDAARGLCTGCGRTREEIAVWSALDEPTRRRIMVGLPARMQAYGLDAANPYPTQISRRD